VNLSAESFKTISETNFLADNFLIKLAKNIDQLLNVNFALVNYSGERILMFSSKIWPNLIILITRGIKRFVSSFIEKYCSMRECFRRYLKSC
jgi:hypothetical protein